MEELYNLIIGLFLLMEVTNVFALYFRKNSKRFNSTGVFNQYAESAKDPHLRNFVDYLINWVAGTKIIFITIIVVVVLYADKTTKIFVTLALILSILTFYLGLYPLVKKMDKAGQLDPHGYSKMLFIMITIFVLVLGIGLLNLFV